MQGSKVVPIISPWTKLCLLTMATTVHRQHNLPKYINRYLRNCVYAFSLQQQIDAT